LLKFFVQFSTIQQFNSLGNTLDAKLLRRRNFTSSTFEKLASWARKELKILDDLGIPLTVELLNC